jgi:Flp pilus assembly protein TadG
MTLSGRSTPGAARRGRGESGTAILEFTLVAVLLLTIVFGIINFGIILSFKQDMTRAAAEGARAAAVALPSSAVGTTDPRRLAAVAATDEAVAGFKKTCGSGGMTCTVQIHDCNLSLADSNVDPNPDSNGYKNNNSPTAQPDCVTVKLSYDYENHPLLVPVPLISAFLPDSIFAKSVVRLNE